MLNCCREFPCVMEHDDRNVMSVSEAFMMMLLAFPMKKCGHSPRWPTYEWRSCMICAYACHSFGRKVGNSALNYGYLSASFASPGRVCYGPIIL